MSELNMVVLVKGVPDFREGVVQFKDDNTLNRGATPTVLNPNDHMALEAAREVQVKHGGMVTVMTMGPPNYARILQEAMQIAGDRGYLISDRKFAAADTWATAHALMCGIKKLGNVDLVFAGFKSADGETGQTGPQTALVLDYPIITHTTSLEVDPEGQKITATRVSGDEIEHCVGPLPAFIVTDPGFAPNYATATHRLGLLDHMDNAQKNVNNHEELIGAWNAEEVGADPAKIGLVGSPTIVRAVDPIPAAPQERTAEVFNDTSDETIDKVAQIIVKRIKGGA